MTTPGLQRARFTFPCLALTLAAGALLANSARAQQPSYSAGVPWGTVAVKDLLEASGMAASWRNPKVLWTHNDGSKKKFYAVTPAGLHLATFSLNGSVDDVEAIALGPGPSAGVSYLYIGDIGGNGTKDGGRNTVRILRVKEPAVSLTVGKTPPSADFSSAEAFTFAYPGEEIYDAEAMLIEPASGDLYLFTKTSGQSRVYQAAFQSGSKSSPIPLTLAATVPFSVPSDAAISRDGRQILLRREGTACTWTRAEGATVAATLALPSRSAPVIGPSKEPNGEAITFLTDGSGYLTLSEGENPVPYFFQTRLPMAPVAWSALPARVVFEATTVQVPAPVSGYPQPAWIWRRNGVVVPGQTTSTLKLTDTRPDQSGTYEATATNASGTATVSFALTIVPRPDVRVTEVMAQPAGSDGADWWELTNFETTPVDLSGWRFNNDSGDLDSAFVLPPGLIIGPGESIIFVEDMKPEKFRAWWGPALPAATQIITYKGSGLSLNGTAGDTIRLWNAATDDVDFTLTTRSFGPSTAGVSLNYDPLKNVFGGLSQSGINSVAPSAKSTDLGSPGSWLPPLTVPSLTITPASGGLRINFQASAFRWYTLESSPDPKAPAWTLGPSFQATVNGPRFFDVAFIESRKFFRVRVR